MVEEEGHASREIGLDGGLVGLTGGSRMDYR